MSEKPQVVYSRKSFNVEVDYDGEDPLSVPTLFAQLKALLGSPDIGEVGARLHVRFERLDDSQVDTLRALQASSGGFEGVEIVGQHEHVRYSDGTICFRKLSPSGALIEAPDWVDSNGRSIAPPDPN